jgi:hypothetical protein
MLLETQEAIPKKTNTNIDIRDTRSNSKENKYKYREALQLIGEQDLNKQVQWKLRHIYKFRPSSTVKMS